MYFRIHFVFTKNIIDFRGIESAHLFGLYLNIINFNSGTWIFSHLFVCSFILSVYREILHLILNQVVLVYSCLLWCDIFVAIINRYFLDFFVE